MPTSPPGPSRTTIHDVARRAQVSIATVSRVLTGAKPVSAELSERVREAAARLGYRPNPAAQVLLSGHSRTIGVVVPDLANPYFAEVLKGATAAAAAAGWRTLVADTDEDPAAEHQSAIDLARWVDGIVLCSPRMGADQLREVAAAVPPLVVVNRLVRDAAVASVVVDHQRGMALICEHLLSLGHRHVTYLRGPARASAEGQRRRALTRMERRGLTVRRLPCGSTVADGYAAAPHVLEHAPTAVVAFNDNVALGLLSRLRELGVRVPDDMSVTGFDDVPLAGAVDPELTTVTVPKGEVGRLAWQRLAGLGSGPAGAPSRVAVALTVRGTTAPPRATPLATTSAPP